MEVSQGQCWRNAFAIYTTGWPTLNRKLFDRTSDCHATYLGILRKLLNLTFVTTGQEMFKGRFINLSLTLLFAVDVAVNVVYSTSQIALVCSAANLKENRLK